MTAKEATLSQLRTKNTYDNSQAPAVLKAEATDAQKESDKKREATFRKLYTKAKTASQRTALNLYETELTAALKNLRLEQAAARSNYQQSLSSLFASHRTAVDGQLATLKKQIDTAFSNAAAQCPKITIDQVSLQLKNDVKLAQDAYKAGPSLSSENIQMAQRAALETYRTASTKATTTFNETLRLSSAKLKVAFPKTPDIFE